MREVEWWVAKVYPRKSSGGVRIDLWEAFPSALEARKYVRRDNARDGRTPFTVVKLTMETIK